VFWSSEQQPTLTVAKTWWLEGERALDYLAERAETENRLQRIHTLLHPLTETTLPQLLPLVRAFGANPALGRVTLPALKTLLYGEASLPGRLSGFVQQNAVGWQTAAQWLFVAFPEAYPPPSGAMKRVLAPTRKQRQEARERARVAHPDAPAETLPLLTEYALWNAAKEALGVASFVDVLLILSHAHEMPRPRSKPATRVKEATPAYTTSTTEADLLLYIESAIAARGFTFPALAVRRYYLALKAKPFVILAGLSGTGKTRLTALLAEILTGDAAAQYRLFPVRPDWVDPTPLLGYQNPLTDRYVETSFLSFLTEATRPENRHRAYFVCLDEMNVARVEHYFADILSAMETEERRLLLTDGRSIPLPSNLFLTGSVNVDEASHPFSRKVLDRANVIEFSEVHLRASVVHEKRALPEIPVAERQRLFLTPAAPLSDSRREAVLAILSEWNALLTPCGQHFGYRVRDEILRFLASASGLLNDDTALDIQLLQKVLPRLSGTTEALAPLLQTLATAAWERFPLTATKLDAMRRRATFDGFVTYFE
jgi:MoxR-like ATPase